MAISSPEMMLVPGVGVSGVSRHVGILLHSLTKVDVTETAASDLTTDTVLVPHAEVLHVVSGVLDGLAVCGKKCGRVSRVGRARTMVVMFVVDLADEAAVECVGRWRAQ